MHTAHTPSDQRGERILDAASSLILRYGYNKTTMQDIAAQAFISKSTLYLFWKSKEEVFGALITRETRHLFSGWLAAIRGGLAHFRARLVFELWSHAPWQGTDLDKRGTAGSNRRSEGLMLSPLRSPMNDWIEA